MKTRQDNNREKGRFQTGRVVLLSFCHLIHDVYSSFLAPVLPFLIEKFSFTLTQAGFLSTMMQLPALFNPYIGKLADRISVRYFIILAPATTAIPMSLLGVAPGYGVLLILLFFTGLSVSLFHVPAPVMIYKLSGSRAGRGMSFFMTGGELARTIGPLTVVGAISLFGFEGYYPVMIVGILASLIMFFRFRDMGVSIRTKEKVSIGKTWSGLKHILLPLSGIIGVRGFMHACMTAFLPLFIMQQSGNVWLAGISLSMFEAAGVVGILTVGSLSDRFGRRRMLFFCLLVAPVAMLLFARADGGALQFLLLVVTGFSLLSTTPVMLAMIQEYSNDGSSAANGIYMMVSFLARSAVVVVVGLVADKVGLEQTYLLCGAVGLLGIPLVLTIPRDEKSRGR